MRRRAYEDVSKIDKGVTGVICDMQTAEILGKIYETLQRDIWDYLGIIAPLLLSLIAIVISLYNSFFACRKKSIDAKLLWDEFQEDFLVIIRNTGKRTLVIDSVSLIASKKKRNKRKSYELGTRYNVWSENKEKAYIGENETLTFSPCYGSIYDIFGYKGHFFDVSDENENLPVIIMVTDVDGRRWSFATSFTLRELDDKIEFMTKY